MYWSYCWSYYAIFWKINININCTNIQCVYHSCDHSCHVVFYQYKNQHCYNYLHLLSLSWHLLVVCVFILAIIVESVFKIEHYKLSHHTKWRKPICSLCKHGFQDWLKYKWHMMCHYKAEDEWVCDVCGKQLESTAGYWTHMLMHEEDKKKHVCPQCPIRFLYKFQLNQHMQSHSTTARRLTCPSCDCAGKTFLNKDTLKRHMEIRKDEKSTVQLRVVQNSSNVSHYLSDHIRRQHKAAYQCENVLSCCTFTTRSRQTLQEHENYFCTYKPGMSDEWTVVWNCSQDKSF